MSYPALLFVVGLERLGELLYSRRNERAIGRRQPNAPEAGRSVFNRIAASNVALFTLPAVEHRLRRRRPPRIVVALGWLGLLGATTLRLSVLATLRDEWNIRAIVPSDVKVIDRGPYAFIRHPNYVALGLEFLGLPLIGGAYITGTVIWTLNALLLWTRIQEEEALLLAIPAYRERMAAKPRFFPRLFSAR